MTIVKSADCTEIITVMTKMVTVCVTAVLVRLIHMREVKKMTDDTISRAAAVALVEEIESKRLKGEIDLTYAPMIKGIKALPSAQPVCEDAVSRKSVVDILDQADPDLMADLVNRLPSVMPSAQPGWISCSVMLPENDGVYLVTLRAITQLQKACAKIDIARFDGKWHKAYPVVAWMPLPTPYREGGQS